MTDDEKLSVRKEFREAVNMTPKALEAWLDTEESQNVGYTREGDDEAVGHKMGRRIVAMKAKKVADLDDDDFAAMRKVVGYVHRHLAQRPKGDVEDTPWRYSLMNWGHDPLQD